jgi:hypothetical protein
LHAGARGRLWIQRINELHIELLAVGLVLLEFVEHRHRGQVG